MSKKIVCLYVCSSRRDIFIHRKSLTKARETDYHQLMPCLAITKLITSVVVGVYQKDDDMRRERTSFSDSPSTTTQSAMFMRHIMKDTCI